jgi:cell division protein FtsB
MHDFIQNAVNNLYQANELTALKAENARLKAEVEELKSQPDPLTAYLYAAELAKDDIKRLKAEVAHLQSENLLVREESDRHYQLWVNRGHEIERLRKLGTEMGKHLPDTDAANRAYIDFEAGGES